MKKLQSLEYLFEDEFSHVFIDNLLLNEILKDIATMTVIVNKVNHMLLFPYLI